MRALKKTEQDLIIFLLNKKPDNEHLINGLSDLLVEEMSDGEMGSLKFLSNDTKKRKMGTEVSAITLLDIDGIPLSISLNLDEEGELYELDVWKVDFSPLKQLPLYPYTQVER
jgi:hypothetical protein